MKTPEQLKGAIRNISRQNNISAQEVLQRYMFERLLERLSVSPYRKNFILKGGLLISSMIGVSERTTMDMDASVCGITVDKDMLERTFKEILSIDVGDGIVFRYDCMEPIREDDEYDNFRVHIIAEYGKICNRMKIDVTTGDRIIPSAINYSFSSFFDEVKIDIWRTPSKRFWPKSMKQFLEEISAIQGQEIFTIYTFFSNVTLIESIRLVLNWRSRTQLGKEGLSTYWRTINQSALRLLWTTISDVYGETTALQNRTPHASPLSKSPITFYPWENTYLIFS